MELDLNQKRIILDILKTLIYNNFSDLKYKIHKYKPILSPDVYNLLIYGDDNMYNCTTVDGNYYRIITSMENRWALTSILDYHLQRTKKITLDEYNYILNY